MIPSGEVKTLPPSPTATNKLPVQAMESKPSVVPEFRVIQEIPSKEVRMLPQSPTVINPLLAQTTDLR